MKKILFFSCIMAALLSFVGCEEAGNDFEGTNYIYLSAKDGKTTMFETDSEPLEIEVMLTTALEEDLVLEFGLTGTEGVVELQGNLHEALQVRVSIGIYFFCFAFRKGNIVLLAGFMLIDA